MTALDTLTDSTSAGMRAVEASGSAMESDEANGTAGSQLSCLFRPELCSC